MLFEGRRTHGELNARDRLCLVDLLGIRLEAPRLPRSAASFRRHGPAPSLRGASSRNHPNCRASLRRSTISKLERSRSPPSLDDLQPRDLRSVRLSSTSSPNRTRPSERDASAGGLI